MNCAWLLDPERADGHTLRLRVLDCFQCIAGRLGCVVLEHEPESRNESRHRHRDLLQTAQTLVRHPDPAQAGSDQGSALCRVAELPAIPSNDRSEASLLQRLEEYYIVDAAEVLVIGGAEVVGTETWARGCAANGGMFSSR